MVPARLKFLTLAGSLLITCGCAATHPTECSSGGWFSRFRLASRTTGAACECENGGLSYPGGDGSVVVPPNAFVPPNGFAAPPPMILTNPPGVGQPPRIAPIPQASPMPYSPM